jgi:CRISPR system Cascade subunit CasE
MLMYLSRLTLDTRRRKVREYLSNIYDLHRLVMSGFPDAPAPEARAELGVLFRVELDQPGRHEVPVLVQSAVQGEWTRLAPELLVREPESREIGSKIARITDDTLLRFSLVANPSKKVKVEGRRNSARVELHREADQLAWLQRQGKRRGFALPGLAPGFNGGEIRFPQDEDRLSRAQIPAVRVQRLDTCEGRKELHGHAVTVVPVRFDGVLQVKDAVTFRMSLAAGFGPAKAFGCGLLLVAPTA